MTPHDWLAAGLGCVIGTLLGWVTFLSFMYGMRALGVL